MYLQTFTKRDLQTEVESMWHFDVILGLLFYFYFFLKKTSLFFLESTEPLCRQISSPSQDGQSSSRSSLVVAKALCHRISVAVAVLPFRQPKKSSTSAVLPFTGRYPLSQSFSPLSSSSRGRPWPSRMDAPRIRSPPLGWVADPIPFALYHLCFTKESGKCA
jgi:hypothetical protein